MPTRLKSGFKWLQVAPSLRFVGSEAISVRTKYALPVCHRPLCTHANAPPPALARNINDSGDVALIKTKAPALLPAIPSIFGAPDDAVAAIHTKPDAATAVAHGSAIWTLLQLKTLL